MKIIRISFLFAGLFIWMCHPVFSQQISNTDKTYDENIVTVLLHANGNEMQAPVIELGSNEKLELSFDDLSNQYYLFHYTFVHCTSDWKTSDLDPIDYIDGYFEGDIKNYKFSFNTITPYIHYDLVFPTDEMRIKLSGNYILKVYVDDGSGTQTIITRRFYVTETQANISARVSPRPKNVDFLHKKQQIDLQIHTQNIFGDEPEQRFKVNIRQDGRWDNMKTGLHPTSVNQNTLYFDFPDGIVFDGGNEARFFDMKTYRYLSESISRIVQGQNYYNVTLHTDYPRKGKPYETYKTIRGQELITARNDQDPMLEGDYALVHFSLKSTKFQQASVYLMGALTQWNIETEGKMTYNNKSRQYEGQLFLKQGYYEYWYVVVPDGMQKGDVTKVEGDHWETTHSYTVYLYYHHRMPEYDQLLGTQEISAH